MIKVFKIRPLTSCFLPVFNPSLNRKNILSLPQFTTMNTQQIAKGTFTVALKPEAQDKEAGISFGRFSIVKIFTGELQATSKVDMLSAGSETNGHGSYVAIERVTGTLHGKSGAFVLMHMGSRSPAGQELSITVVPGCSTGQLEGLDGKLTISIVDKVHHYEFAYQIN